MNLNLDLIFIMFALSGAALDRHLVEISPGDFIGADVFVDLRIFFLTGADAIVWGGDGCFEFHMNRVKIVKSWKLKVLNFENIFNFKNKKY